MPAAGLTAEGVRMVMEHLQSLYHYTVVDVPTICASSDPALLSGADTIFVICDGSLSGARNAVRLHRSLSAVCSTVHMVLNRAGAPGQISMAELEKVLGQRPDLVIPFLPKQFANAAILGTPAVTGNRRVAAAVGCLAREVSGQDLSRTTFLDRIFRR